MLPPSRGAERAHTLRRLNVPRPAEVAVDDGGAPTALVLKGRRYQVAEVLDRYRTDDRWWTAAPIARTYYELLLEDGRAMTLFRDDLRGGWWEQRYGYTGLT